ncbi:MAG: ribonuclease Z [Candidatus Micrarchaeota archaeon]|nr:ribonuclease Z [Candidatus Micrarchaeota archaeon]
MIRLVMLGTSGAMPTPRSNPSCFAVKFGGVYLFDCSEGCQRQMMKYGTNFGSVKAIFISHLHADHFLGLFGLVQSLNMTGRKEPLQLYGPKGTKKFLGTVFAMKEFMSSFPLEIIEVAPSKKPFYSNELFTVKAFNVKHNAPASLGFVMEGLSYRRFDMDKCKKVGVSGRMFSQLQEGGTVEINGKKVKYADVTYVQGGKKIVYTGDTMQCPAIATNAKDADLLIHDSCFLDKHKDHAKAKMHSTCLDAAKNAKKANVKKLILTHFSNRYDDLAPLLAEAKTVFESTELAEQGKEILI